MPATSSDQGVESREQWHDLEIINYKHDRIDESALNSSTLPPLNYDLSEHRIHIAVYWFLIVLTSGIWPIVLYFALRDGAHSSLYTTFGVCLAIPGVLSLYSETKRTWRLWKKDSIYRPIGQTNRWAFDAFQWNFVVAAIIVTVLICVGASIPNYPVSSLPLAALLLQVSLELLLAELALTLAWRAPFRISSTDKGQLTKPGVYVIVEDVIAVDGGGGTAFRKRWNARYVASPVLRAHLRLMDYLWGVSGIVVTAVIFAVVFADISPEAGYAVGWALPWVWAGFMAWLTIAMTKSMLRRERGGVSEKAETVNPST